MNTQDVKIKKCLEALQESTAELKKLRTEHPETPIGSVDARVWLYAQELQLDHLMLLLHDLQPTLF